MCVFALKKKKSVLFKYSATYFLKIPGFSSAHYLQQAPKNNASFESWILISNTKLEGKLAQSLEADNPSDFVSLPSSQLGIWVEICGFWWILSPWRMLTEDTMPIL